MDPKNASEMLKHLEKQNELLQDAHRKMSKELQRLQVEEEMMMRKFYLLTKALGLDKKENELRILASNDSDNEESNAIANVPNEGL